MSHHRPSANPHQQAHVEGRPFSVLANGALTSIPFGILVTSDPKGKKLKDVDWLINSYAVTVGGSPPRETIAPMSVTRQSLEEKFRLFNDEELRRLYYSDDLTELATRSRSRAESQAKPRSDRLTSGLLAGPPACGGPNCSSCCLAFSGRINRAKYWFAVVIFSVTMLIVWIVFSFAAWIVGDITLGLLFFVIAVIVYTLPLISFIAIGIKRLHDRDKSG